MTDVDVDSLDAISGRLVGVAAVVLFRRGAVDVVPIPLERSAARLVRGQF